ncbi:T9SS type A sorting domain-containing protein [uncultured Polaribacter sp.]|uniref:T9SS type A sorting domain-containing protein n=1 Tax=uncultured Polaribacter sp. TaxID=174711 RepID=UPI00262ABBD5|nr:T9SS type A sorting domain-containing protein [uncultured Polaribacter sp.]
MNLQKHFIFICAILFGLNMYSQTIGPWNVTELKQTPNWTTTNVDAVAGMTGILYESIDYLNNPVEVFAYYSAPTGTPPAGGWPAAIFVSGGLGDAFPEAVKYWNDRGYAAISMDTFGDFPNGTATPNPGPGRNGVFNDWTLPIEDQWYYHAVAQVVKAHSLIASFSEVNANKIGIMGASWGGTITGTIMGLDDRLAWAFPIYGCGYLRGSDGSQGNAIGTGAKAAFVMDNYDGSLYFNNVTFPTLFLNRMRDGHFDMSQNQLSSRAVQGSTGLILLKNWGHGNTNWTELEEPYAFAESVVNGGDPLPEVGKPYITFGTGYVTATSSVGISSATMHYTNDGDNVELNEKNWISIDANISGNNISASIPETATIIIFEVSDSRGLIKSSEYIFNPDAVVITPSENLALNGTATQSTTLNDRGPELAIDNNTDGVYNRGSVTVAESTLESQAWWQVDLGGEYNISDINIFNRTDVCCVDRLSNFTLTVTDNNGTEIYTETITTAPNPDVNINVNGAIGQVIRIESNLADTNLNLAEVQVFGDAILGVEDKKKADRLVVHPNPVSNSITIDFKGSQAAKMKIIDSRGKIIIQDDIQYGTNTINLSNLSSGLYIIKVSDENETYTRKMIKK